MSIALMTEVWRLDLNTSDKMVLLALADWSNEEGACWPSMAQLAKKSGLTDRAIRAVVGRLVSQGHLTRREVPGKGVNYVVHPGTSFRPARPSPRKETALTPEPASANTSTTIKPTSEAKASSVAVREPKAKASRRCPADWSPSPADIAVAEGEGFSPGEIERELATIRDFEFRNARSDWSATFRNWFRREAKSRKPRNDPTSRYDAKQSNYHDSLTGAGHASEVLAFRRAF